MEQTTLIAFLGKDAAVTQNEDHFLVNFSAAVTSKFIKDGEEKEKTNWYSIFKRYRKDPAKMLAHLKKGAKVFIQGTPSYQIYNGDQGINVSVTINAEKLNLLTFQDV